MVKIFIKFILATVIVFCSTSTLWCFEQTVVYYTFQYGIQHTGIPATGVGRTDSYLSTLENEHGEIKENRQVSPIVLSFDFYKTNGAVASGFGIEGHSYKKIYTFVNDSSQITIQAAGLLYGLSFYYRGNYWYPFIGFGTGNYSAKVKEELAADRIKTFGTVFGQVDKPFYYKFGARIPFNGMGFIITQQYISADIEVATVNKPLSLGGSATLLGMYTSF